LVFGLPVERGLVVFNPDFDFQYPDYLFSGEWVFDGNGVIILSK
jgi:hypothetical protein